jgi:hypothetical protein
MGEVDDGRDDEVVERWRAGPRIVFLDSCTLQWIHDYGGFVWEDEPLAATDRLNRQGDGPSELAALSAVMAVGIRGALEFAVSPNSLSEVRKSGRRGYLQWRYDVADYWNTVVEEGGWALSSPQRHQVEQRLSSMAYGYLGQGDRALLADAIAFGCDVFLTVEKKLARNAHHLEKTLGLRVLRPGELWTILQPWAALYR